MVGVYVLCSIEAILKLHEIAETCFHLPKQHEFNAEFWTALSCLPSHNLYQLTLVGELLRDRFKEGRFELGIISNCSIPPLKQKLEKRLKSIYGSNLRVFYDTSPLFKQSFHIWKKAVCDHKFLVTSLLSFQSDSILNRFNSSDVGKVIVVRYPFVSETKLLVEKELSMLQSLTTAAVVAPTKLTDEFNYEDNRDIEDKRPLITDVNANLQCENDTQGTYDDTEVASIDVETLAEIVDGLLSLMSYNDHPQVLPISEHLGLFPNAISSLSIALKYCRLYWGWSVSDITAMVRLIAQSRGIQLISAKNTQTPQTIRLQDSDISSLMDAVCSNEVTDTAVRQFQFIEMTLTNYFLNQFQSPQHLRQEYIVKYIESNSPLQLQLFQSSKHLSCYYRCRAWLHAVECTATQYHRKLKKKLITEEILQSTLDSLLNSVVFVNIGQFDGLKLTEPSSSAIDFISTGFAVQWNDANVSSCSQEFISAKLFHFYPIWSAARGLALVIQLLSQTVKQIRKTESELSLYCHKMIVLLCKLLLRSKADHLAMKSSYSPILHSIEVLSSLRGYCWEMLITSIRSLRRYSSSLLVQLSTQAQCEGNLTPEARTRLKELHHLVQEECNQSVGGHPADEMNSSPKKSKSFHEDNQSIIISDEIQLNSSEQHAIQLSSVVRERVIVASYSQEKRQSNNKLLFTITHETIPKTLVSIGKYTQLLEEKKQPLQSMNGIFFLHPSQRLSICDHILTAHATSKMEFDASCSEISHNKLYVEQVAMFYYLHRLSHYSPSPQSPPAAVGTLALRIRSSVGFVAFLDHEAGLVEGLAIRQGDNGSGSDMWAASWCETRMWMYLLYLLLWEEIYDPTVPFSQTIRPFLDKPLDYMPEYYIDDVPPMKCDGFWSRRKGKIREKFTQLEKLSREELLEYCKGQFQARLSLLKSHLPWDKLDCNELFSLTAAIGIRRLSVILCEMLEYPNSYCRGGPDILFWRVTPPPVRSKPLPSANNFNLRNNDTFDYDDILAVEVKSLNDSLSVWQMNWIDLLQKAKIPIEILRVIPKESIDLC